MEHLATEEDRATAAEQLGLTKKMAEPLMALSESVKVATGLFGQSTESSKQKGEGTY